MQEPPCRCKRRGHRWERRCSTCLQDPALPTSACPSPSFPRSPGLMEGTVPPSDNPAWSPFLVSTSQPCQEEQCCLPGGPLKAEGSDPTSSLLPASPDVSQLFPITCSALHILRAKIPLPADPCSHSSDNLLHTSCSHHPFSPYWLQGSLSGPSFKPPCRDPSSEEPRAEDFTSVSVCVTDRSQSTNPEVKTHTSGNTLQRRRACAFPSTSLQGLLQTPVTARACRTIELTWRATSPTWGILASLACKGPVFQPIQQ